MSGIFNTFLYEPLYNALVFLVGVFPGHDMGFAVIALTILVRLVLYPLSRQAIKTQIAMKEITPEIEALKKKHEDDKEAQAKAIFGLYKERGIRPFAGALVMFVQLPVFIALYWVFSNGGWPVVDVKHLYAGIQAPASVNMMFLGLINLQGHSIVLAALASLSQFAYTRLSMGPRATVDPSPVEASLSGDMARSFDFQMRYFLPLMMGVIGYTVVAAATLYLVVSNVSMIVQELASGRTYSTKKTK